MKRKGWRALSEVDWWALLRWALLLALGLGIVWVLLAWLGSRWVGRSAASFAYRTTPEPVRLEYLWSFSVPPDFRILDVPLSPQDPPGFLFAQDYGVGMADPRGRIRWILVGRYPKSVFPCGGRTVYAVLHETVDSAGIHWHLDFVEMATGRVQYRVPLPPPQGPQVNLSAAGIFKEKPLTVWVQYYLGDHSELLFLDRRGRVLQKRRYPANKAPVASSVLRFPPALTLVPAHSGQAGTSGEGLTDENLADLLIWGATGALLGRLTTGTLYGRVFPVVTPRGAFVLLTYSTEVTVGWMQETRIYRVDPGPTWPTFHLVLRSPYNADPKLRRMLARPDNRDALVLRTPPCPRVPREADTLVLLGTHMMPVDSVVLPRVRGLPVRGAQAWWIWPDSVALLMLERRPFREDPQMGITWAPAPRGELYAWDIHFGLKKLLAWPLHPWKLAGFLDPFRGLLYLQDRRNRVSVWRVHPFPPVAAALQPSL